MTSMLLLLGSDSAPWPAADGGLFRSMAGAVLVLALLGLFAWMVKRGGLLQRVQRKHAAITVETAGSVGERRSLVVVAVEGRRLLLGLTPVHVSFVTELRPGQPFDQVLDRSLTDPKGTS